MFSRQQVGKVPTRVSTTKMSNAPWSRQKFNLFSGEPAPQQQQPQQQQQEEDGENGRPQQQQQQKHRSGDNNIFAKPSTRVHAAPGGRSSVASLLCDAPAAPAAPQHAPARRPSAMSALIEQTQQPQQQAQQQAPRERASSRVLSVPGGASSMGRIMNGAASPPAAAAASKLPQCAKPTVNIFSGPQATAGGRSSTRRIAVPGGSSDMSSVMAHQCAPEEAHGIRTAKTNASHSVVNLTPMPVRPQTTRTSKINEESGASPEHAKPAVAHASAALQKSLASSIFSFSDEIDAAAAAPAPVSQKRFVQPERAPVQQPVQPVQQQPVQQQQQAKPQQDATLHGTGKPSTKVHHAPGGRSSGNFIGGW